MAGNLWSSFLAIDCAVKSVGCFSAPIGGLTDPALLFKYMKDLKLNVLVGLPSIILSLAEYAIRTKVRLKVDKIFYAGEHVAGPNSSRRLLV